MGSDDGAIVHAQLTYDGGTLMLGSAGDTEFDRLQKTPRTAGGVGTQSAYIVVADPNAHYQRAVAAGAEVVVELRDQGNGLAYSCRDPEGHLWNFGDYDPWNPPTSE